MEKIREAMAGYIAVLMEYGDRLPQDVWSARMPVEVAA